MAAKIPDGLQMGGESFDHGSHRSGEALSVSLGQKQATLQCVALGQTQGNKDFDLRLIGKLK